QAEDGIRDFHVTGVQTCALPISDGLLLLATLDVGAFLEQGLQLFTEVSDGTIVVTGEQIAVEGDIAGLAVADAFHLGQPQLTLLVLTQADQVLLTGTLLLDRKSTRLNSSHV